MADKPAKARIRDNQRRSRANKKEYVASLEQKIAEYNAQGVQATIEMQTAARAVALENERLRKLLGEVGVSSERINSYLQSFSVSPEPQTQRLEIPKCMQCEKLPRIAGSCVGPCGGSRKPTDKRVLPPPDMPEPKVREVRPAEIFKTGPSFCSEYGGDTTLETPCEAAASIILQMKGHGDKSTLYTKFGCRSGSIGSCTIKNTDLFRIMDEEH
ncbi:hypothetical protein TWF569_008956 [Orbilia oligospora]|uniref:BZIP domain-containing protein n=1 Tax=Orbilia oligospora TaxID=2813651 RepID=A0A7C8J3P0_ORBOL|nr:hypothetical protein TWF102_010564 [Orbilia oligospora]KAF3105830.1 hypothetical protein TWF103_006529 [Orbilia oligospora]KAF3155587.1 hypothetical protein TWF569_008956 [Orbilia oligospora]